MWAVFRLDVTAVLIYIMCMDAFHPHVGCFQTGCYGSTDLYLCMDAFHPHVGCFQTGCYGSTDLYNMYGRLSSSCGLFSDWMLRQY